jgi:hypothetical protein
MKGVSILPTGCDRAIIRLLLVIVLLQQRHVCLLLAALIIINSLSVQELAYSNHCSSVLTNCTLCKPLYPKGAAPMLLPLLERLLSCYCLQAQHAT